MPVTKVLSTSAMHPVLFISDTAGDIFIHEFNLEYDIIRCTFTKIVHKPYAISFTI